MSSILACPVCGLALEVHATNATCSNAHAFDRARTGYLNLILANKKQSAEPGDSPAMLSSRRAFLDAGFYDQMSDAATDAVMACINRRAQEAHVVDLGCGEGFFTGRLKRALGESSLPASCYGLDVSRQGIKRASGRDRAMTWIVGSLHRCPFLAQSVDVALTIFAPIDPDEVHRILRPEGAFVTVTPGPDHLDELRAMIYSSLRPHPKTPTPLSGDTRFELRSTARVNYSIVIESSAQIRNLLAMTPFYWHITPEGKARVEALERLEVLVDVYVNVFRPVARSG